MTRYQPNRLLILHRDMIPVREPAAKTLAAEWIGTLLAACRQELERLVKAVAVVPAMGVDVAVLGGGVAFTKQAAATRLNGRELQRDDGQHRRLRCALPPSRPGLP
ncbi:hypothetical protein [Phytohabitans rumicis]|uniref:Uncharacterized protein n=1 Tax=Phytohabitans rumicis TaxID=1076125 RepID=A0A6V8LDY8_9ACTN|nr:hypothetical protein [Phytohabitans rumicis]GFJ95443.1 hypothetical protein Prum_090850 [Phytohabitans rumicis]